MSEATACVANAQTACVANAQNGLSGRERRIP